jgi:hypothetical protein
LSSVAGQTAYFDNIIVTEALADNSGQDNPLQVIGQILRQPYLPPCDDRFGICTDAANYVQGMVTGSGPLAGYIQLNGVWLWKSNLLNYPGVSLVDQVLKVSEGCYAELVWDGSGAPDMGGFDSGFDEGFD